MKFTSLSDLKNITTETILKKGKCGCCHNIKNDVLLPSDVHKKLGQFLSFTDCICQKCFDKIEANYKIEADFKKWCEEMNEAGGNVHFVSNENRESFLTLFIQKREYFEKRLKQMKEKNDNKNKNS